MSRGEIVELYSFLDPTLHLLFDLLQSSVNGLQFCVIELFFVEVKRLGFVVFLDLELLELDVCWRYSF